MIDASAPAKLRHRSLYRVRLLGSVGADEVMPAAELRRRLGWARKAYTRARADGLRVIRYGRTDYCLGVDVLAFFQGRQQAQAVSEQQ